MPIRPDRYFSSSTRMVLLVWAVCLVGAYLLYFFTRQDNTERRSSLTGRSSSRAPPTFEAPPPVGDQVPVVPAPPIPVPRPPSPEEVATAKLQWIRFKSRVEEVREQLQAVSQDNDVWSSLTKELPHNEAGRRIAGSPTHVDQFHALVVRPRTPARGLTTIRETLDVHLQTAQEYLSQSGNTAIPSPALTRELDDASSNVQALAQEYREDRLALQTLVSETDSVAMAEQPLEQVLEQRTAAVAREYREQLAKAKADAEAEAQRILRETEAAGIKAKAEAEANRRAVLAAVEAQRIRYETEQHMISQKEAAAKKQRDDEAKRLRALAQDLVIQSRYSPFLKAGHFQFGGLPFRKSDRPLPVSFGELSNKGFLDSVESFAKAMSRSPAPNWSTINDRPTYALPRTTAEWAEMDRLWKQFLQLAPVWIEMGLLRP